MDDHPVDHQYDVIIIGAGLVGSIAAVALSQAGIKVALVDHTDAQVNLNAHYDGRTLAIAYGSKNILEQWHIWPLIEQYATPIKNICISSSKPYSLMHFDGQPVADHPMGYIVEIQHLRRTLFKLLNTNDHCHLLIPQSLTHIEQTSDGIIVHLQNNQKIYAQMAIGADGRQSATRQHLGIQPKTWHYHQTSIVGVINHDKAHHNVAFEHFTPDGPLALLPMRGNYSSLVWTLPIPKAQAFMNLTEVDFNEELERCFGHNLGRLSLQGKRWAYDLQGLYCRSWYRGRVALIGDACHVIHPVAGQGFNLGLRDAHVLTSLLIHQFNNHSDLGSDKLLLSYQRQRRVDSISMTAMTDGLVRLFSNNNLLLGSLRSIGIKITDRLPFIKKSLTKHAMGLRN